MAWKTILTAGILFASSSAFAYLTINESGDLIAPGSFRAGFEPQAKLSDGGGGNIAGFVDGGISDEWSWRALLGTGDTDFWLTGSAKWIPIPDYQSQPAIGARFDYTLGREDGANFNVFRAAPMASKGFDSEVGRFVPYVALPLGVFASNGDSNNFSQLVVGSEAKLEQVPDWMFSAELGFNLSKSFSYISATASYFFDGGGGSKKAK